MKTLFKKTLIITIALGAIGFFGYFLWKYMYKSKAGSPNVVFDFIQNSNPFEFKQNEEKNINFTLSTENHEYKISAIDLYFVFDLNNKNLLDFIEFNAWRHEEDIQSQPVSYFDEVLIQKVSLSDKYNKSKILRITAVTKKQDDQLSPSIIGSLKFKANSINGSSSIFLLNDEKEIDMKNQIVGITKTSNNYFYLLPSNSMGYTINSDSICKDDKDVCGVNASCSNNTCSCNNGFYNCDGNWNNGCESNKSCLSITPSPTPTPTNIPVPRNPTNSPTPTRRPIPNPTLTPTITSTPTPTNIPVPRNPTNSPTPINTPTPTTTPAPESVTLNLKLKFQGILKKPTSTDKMNVKVKLGGRQSADPKIVTFTSDNNGVWSGSVNFNVTTGSGYLVYIKGPKHLQKKICDPLPTETVPATYHCGQGKITLSAGNNNLDFSGIFLSSGDLPNQDGVSDSYDLSLVRNNLGQRDDGALRLADINLDGVVNTQDYSAIIQALAVRTDEE
ncbi:MAG: dockerin type I domain-containing protein [Patescibacteria group bacterium]|nr:dockerin type I domain-containing protein [Patescibacteria group bacterium]